MSSIADVILNLQFSVQRYGPPPSYPQLKIPGLNAPIPPGAKFGYQPGGWGKPPVDEVGFPTCTLEFLMLSFRFYCVKISSYFEF